MDYKPRSNYNNKSSLTYKKNRCFWFNSEFNEDFIINNGKIYEIIFKVPPFQIYKNNNMKVITYIRGSQNSRPIIIKMKEPFLSYQTIFNSDNEAHPVIYINHTGVEGMTSITPNYSLIPQQIPRFIFRFDDNFNKLDFSSYFTSITNGSLFQVAGGGNNDKYITFNSSGSFVLDKSLTCDILVVGGGGGGGVSLGSGGGGGGVVYITNYTLNNGSYTITIGAGGSPMSSNGDNTTPNGGNSTINNGSTDVITALGGARGNGQSSGATTRSGGSGAGGVRNYTTGGSGTQTTDTSISAISRTNGYGSAGGTGDSGVPYMSGGGGGAGAVGGNSSSTKAGDGGVGIQINITGTNIYYGGGGGGGAWDGQENTIAGSGGLGGGGNGSRGDINAGNGLANTGGGGGGRGGTTSGTGGTGGSGVVIIRFRETRQEGLTPDETIITSTNNSLTIPVNSKYNINYGDYFNIPKGSYQALFSNGSITLNSITDKSYPILKDANNNNINPLIWYKFDDGDLKVDSSGNNYTLTASATPPTVDTTNFVKGNGSALFNSSTNTYLIMPRLNYNQINTNTGISFCVWARLTNSSDAGSSIFEVSSYGAINANILIVRAGSGNDLAFYSERTGTTTVNISTSGINFFDGTWKFIVWTISTTGFWTIYSNGVSILTNSGRILPVLDSANNTDFIGSRSDQLTVINGNLDDFRIYDRTLTQAQVSELYNGRLSIYNPPEFILGVEIKDA